MWYPPLCHVPCYEWIEWLQHTSGSQASRPKSYVMSYRRPNDANCSRRLPSVRSQDLIRHGSTGCIERVNCLSIATLEAMCREGPGSVRVRVFGSQAKSPSGYISSPIVRIMNAPHESRSTIGVINCDSALRKRCIFGTVEAREAE